jgi:hypothetical protein
MQVSVLCSIAPNRFAQQLGGPREWAWLAKEGIYNLHHEIEPLPLGAKIYVDSGQWRWHRTPCLVTSQ